MCHIQLLEADHVPLNMQLSDRYRLVGIKTQCGTVSLAHSARHLMAARLMWLGHAPRMPSSDEGRLPQVAMLRV